MAANFLDEAGLSVGGELLGDILDSLTLFLLKGECGVGTDRVIRQVLSLRPATLMNTYSKLIACVVNELLSAVADAVSCSAQRGFVPVHEFGDNVLELESALVELSLLERALPTESLFDFERAFPWLAREWIWMVIQRFGIFA